MAIGHDLTGGRARTGGEPDGHGIRGRRHLPHHAGPGQRQRRGALAQPGHDQANKYQCPGHQQEEQPAVERGTAAQADRDGTRNEARSGGPGTVAHDRARRGTQPTDRHHRQARAFPLMTTQIRTLRRPDPARHAGITPDPAHPPGGRMCLLPRITFHNRDYPRSPVRNGACKTGGDDFCRQRAHEGPSLWRHGWKPKVTDRDSPGGRYCRAPGWRPWPFRSQRGATPRRWSGGQILPGLPGPNRCMFSSARMQRRRWRSRG
jgi:hypothetical protein